MWYISDILGIFFVFIIVMILAFYITFSFSFSLEFIILVNYEFIWKHIYSCNSSYSTLPTASTTTATVTTPVIHRHQFASFSDIL
jgi:hypothetical protein